RDDSKTIYSRLRIIHADSISYLESLQTEEQRPDLVFLDPMFPLREKSALSCKEMQILQFLSQPSPERDIHILKSAQHVVRDRVIVKRPLNSPPLLEGARHTYKGKSVRYDVYFPES
ncbi:MAG: class I SAM-dependent methyltransferase, partial [Bdellovibrionales bacterium]|nr:class I SAM-dependent methyltransferase [Bdellovibrionales bacterium]